MTYHHGDLRPTVLAAAAEAIARDGVAALSLRSLAREVGVTHTAPRHHFGDKRGVLTALAAQGYRLLAEEVSAGVQQGGLLEAGVAYVEFAQSRPGHFAVMFQPDLVSDDDPELVTERDGLYAALQGGLAAFLQLRAGSAGGEDGQPADDSLGLAAWSMAHGFATLAKAGALRPGPGESLADTTRRTLRHLA